MKTKKEKRGKAPWVAMKGGLKPNGFGTVRPKRTLMKVYRQKKDAFLRRNPTCAVCKKRRSVHVHHKFGRGRLLMDEALWLAVCFPCHDEIHRFPDRARKAGYLAQRGQWKNPRKPQADA